MTLAAGTRVGGYEILAPLGAGGMGEVYRARDAKLNRDVAIKILPAALAADPDAQARFQREAQAVAALSHPNILGIFDFGVDGGTPYAVTELLEGTTLRERVAEGAVPPRKAIEYAVRIATGLAAAHERGITHRDLKPENVYLTRDGRVKILDFGLAKMGAAAVAAVGASMEATLQVTSPGTVLGTVGYMSPEQVRGREADHRSDIFSLGAVLFEMLAGERAFTGDSAVETMNAILKADPPELLHARATLPPALDRIVRRCLEKNPDERFQSARDLAFALDAISGSSAKIEETAATSHGTPGLPWRTIAAAGLALALVAIVAYTAGNSRSASRTPAPVRFSLPPPAGFTFRDLSVSPDGRSVALMAYGADVRRLFVRRLDDDRLLTVDGVIEPEYLFWSADSQSVIFCDSGSLKQVAATGGAVRTVAPCSAPRGFGVSLPDGSIEYVPNYLGPVVTLAATAGAPPVEQSVRLPPHMFVRQILPLDAGRRLLVARPHFDDAADAGVYLAERGKPDLRLIVPGQTEGIALVGGWLLYLRGDVLVAQNFDQQSATVSGPTVNLAQPVARFTASTTGTVAALLSPRGLMATRRISWFSRDGTLLSTTGEAAYLLDLRLSPDGKRLAVGRQARPWIYDVARGAGGRATQDALGIDPVWSPDGQTLAVISAAGLLSISLSGDGKIAPFPGAPAGKEAGPMDWSRDGRYLAFAESRLDRTAMSLLPLTGGAPVSIGSFRLQGGGGRFSPDSRWLAYYSDESGRLQVYVKAVPGSGAATQVSTDTGSFPVWRPDGQAIFYRGAGQMLMEVPVRMSGAVPDIGAPRPLFKLKGAVDWNSLFDVTPDGQRFVMITESDPDPSPVTLILNWSPPSR